MMRFTNDILFCNLKGLECIFVYNNNYLFYFISDPSKTVNNGKPIENSQASSGKKFH